jgi:hypothetical protein
MTGDMKFVGIFQIILGALSCLSIFGAITGIPMLISGIRARESADAFENYQRHSDPNWLASAFRGQAAYFKMQKIVAIVTIVLVVLMIVFYAAIIGFVVHNGIRRPQFPSA